MVVKKKKKSDTHTHRPIEIKKGKRYTISTFASSSKLSSGIFILWTKERIIKENPHTKKRQTTHALSKPPKIRPHEPFHYLRKQHQSIPSTIKRGNIHKSHKYYAQKGCKFLCNLLKRCPVEETKHLKGEEKERKITGTNPLTNISNKN